MHKDALPHTKTALRVPSDSVWWLIFSPQDNKMTSGWTQPWFIVSSEVYFYICRFLHGTKEIPLEILIHHLSFLKDFSVIFPYICYGWDTWWMQQIQLPLWIMEPSAMITALQYSLFYMKLNSHPHLKQSESSTCWRPLQGKRELFCMAVMWMAAFSYSIFTATHSRCSPSVWEHTATIWCKSVTTSAIQFPLTDVEKNSHQALY